MLGTVFSEKLLTLHKIITLSSVDKVLSVGLTFPGKKYGKGDLFHFMLFWM